MAEQCWACETCGAVYRCRAAAELCEASPPLPPRLVRPGQKMRIVSNAHTAPLMAWSSADDLVEFMARQIGIRQFHQWQVRDAHEAPDAD